MTAYFKQGTNVGGISIDISKQNLSDGDCDALIAYAKKAELIESFRAMCAGEIVNPAEGRAALHTSLRRNKRDVPFYTEVSSALARMLEFAEDVRNGIWRGSKNDKITDVINIGIGGSDIGPKAVWHALRPLQPKINLHFLSAADGVAFERVIARLNPYTTLVVVSSKSFKTVETLANTRAIDVWFAKYGIVEERRNSHMVVASACPDAACQLGLSPNNLFPFWEWVGGRFSVWGSVGLPLAITLGADVFRQFLAGACVMDEHAIEAPIESNMPAILSLLAYLNITKRNMPSYCMLPYDERLRGIVPWLQQLEMESLGKAPKDKKCQTGARVWGGHGNESQHSFYQWLRAGTGNTAIDVCWCEKSGHAQDELHSLLISSAKAQVEALANRDNPTYQNAISTICIDELTPSRLGALMALYEHKTVMLGTLFDINPFDQPGVEYGKKLTIKLLQLEKTI